MVDLISWTTHLQPVHTNEEAKADSTADIGEEENTKEITEAEDPESRLQAGIDDEDTENVDNTGTVLNGSSTMDVANDNGEHVGDSVEEGSVNKKGKNKNKQPDPNQKTVSTCML